MFLCTLFLYLYQIFIIIIVFSVIYKKNRIIKQYKKTEYDINKLQLQTLQNLKDFAKCGEKKKNLFFIKGFCF